MTRIEELLLGDTETVLWASRPEPGPILVVGLTWFVFLAGFTLSVSALFITLPLSILAIILTALALFSVIHFWLAATQTRYIVTDEQLFVYDGGIRPVTAALERDSITRIDVQQGRTESLLNTGRIVFWTDDDRLLTLSSLPAPVAIARQISKHLPEAELDEEMKTTTQVKGVTWPRSFAKAEKD